MDDEGNALTAWELSLNSRERPERSRWTKRGRKVLARNLLLTQNRFLTRERSKSETCALPSAVGRNISLSPLETEQLFRFDTFTPRAQVLDFIDQVTGATRTIATLTIPESD